MTTTTIRIEDDLKARVAAAAERVGKTSHAFIVDAIAETVEQAERADDFHRLAEARWSGIVATGKTISWEDARSYVEARSRGERTRKPNSRKFPR